MTPTEQTSTDRAAWIAMQRALAASRTAAVEALIELVDGQHRADCGHVIAEDDDAITLRCSLGAESLCDDCHTEHVNRCPTCQA